MSDRAQQHEFAEDTNPLASLGLSEFHAISLPKSILGSFMVGETGKVSFDLLFAKKQIKGDLGLFSLKGMELRGVESEDFTREAIRRIASHSSFGRLLLRDKETIATQTLEMQSGETFAWIFFPEGIEAAIARNIPPILSLTTGNFADVGDSGIVAMEGAQRNKIDTLTGQLERPYTDLIFRIEGAIGRLEKLDDLITSAQDWRKTSFGREILTMTSNLAVKTQEHNVIEVEEIKTEAIDLFSDRGELETNNKLIEEDIELERSHSIQSEQAQKTSKDLFTSGVFTVGESGEVGFDFLFDGGKHRSELAIFSLEGMGDYEFGSTAFIKEATRRALSNSKSGYIIIKDREEGAKFEGKLGEKSWNQGEYEGVKTFQMEAGDRFGVMLIPNGTVEKVHKNPKIKGAKSPLFSIATKGNDFGQIADLNGEGHTFAMEDVNPGHKWFDRDYNDIIFQVIGATGTAQSFDNAVNPEKDWRQTELGQEILEYIKSPETITEKVKFIVDALYNPSESLTISGLVTDEDGKIDISRVDFWLQQDGGEWIDIDDALEFIKNGDRVKFRYDLGELDPGKYRIKATPYDREGKVGEVYEDAFTVLSVSQEEELSDRVKMAIERSMNLQTYDPHALAKTTEWVVSIQKGVDVNRLATVLGAKNLGETGQIANTYRWEFARGIDPHAIADLLNMQVGVEFAYPLVPLNIQWHSSPSDEPYVQNEMQWHLESSEIDVNVADVWEQGIFGTGQTIGIVDSGFELHDPKFGLVGHPDLVENYRPDLSWDFAENDAIASRLVRQNIYFNQPEQSILEKGQDRRGIDSPDVKPFLVQRGHNYFKFDSRIEEEITDLWVDLDIDHDEVSALEVYLVSPSETDLDGKEYRLELDDRGNFSGYITAFDGENAAGKWMIKIIDRHPNNGRVGTLKNIVLRVNATEEDHGTKVAGIAIANGENNLWGTGIAPDADWAALRLGLQMSDRELASVLYDPNPDFFAQRNQDIAIYNNSWGFQFYKTQDGDSHQYTAALTEMAIENGAKYGRQRLGNIYVFSAGNNAGKGGNVNYNALANSRYTIAVAAIDPWGRATQYSEPGASVLVSAYSNAGTLDDGDRPVVTTGMYSDDGNDRNDYTISAYGEDNSNGFGGTSSAAPFVSGVTALMLEVNPSLTWRDVQHILVKSSNWESIDDPDADWTGESSDRIRHSHEYGFGVVDAAEAVELARTWTTVGEEIKVKKSEYVALKIPDFNPNNPESLTSTIEIAIEDNLQVEWVKVLFNGNHDYLGDLKLVLTSPNQTKSILSQQHGENDEANQSYGGDPIFNWTFTSVRHWGESAAGKWTLEVADEYDGNELISQWTSWQLNLYGTQINTPPTLTQIDSFEAVQNQPFVIAYADLLAASDASDADGDAIAFIIEALHSGTLTKDGVAVAVGTQISEGDVLEWTPESSGDDISAFSIKATDGMDASANAIDVTVDVADSYTPVKIGDEFQVNTQIEKAQKDPSIAALTDGGYVVTWTSLGQDGDEEGIFGQRYDSLGNAIGNEFQVNSHTASKQELSSVTALQDGGYLVTWTSFGQDSSFQGIFGQRYDRLGNLVGNEIQINSHYDNVQSHPSVTSLIDGSVVVTWMSYGQDGSDYGIYGQRYDSAGNALENEFQINATVNSIQKHPSIASLSDGGFVVTWMSYGQDGSFYGIYGQRYNSTGNVLGNEFQINTHTADSQWLPAVTGLENGGFAVVWGSMRQDGSDRGIFGRSFDKNGVAIADEFQVNTYTQGDQLNPAIAKLSDGGFIVTWQSLEQDGDGAGIFGQRFSVDGTAIGDEFQVNTFTEGNQQNSVVAVLENGNFVVAWDSENQDGSDTGVYNQIFGVTQVSNRATFFTPDTPYLSFAHSPFSSSGDAMKSVIHTASYNGHTYHLLDTDGTKWWLEAEEEAIALGGHLVTINDAAENQWVQDTFGRIASDYALANNLPDQEKITLWIGLSDHLTERKYQWSSGEQVQYSNWSYRQPGNDAADEDFIGMYASTGQWHDLVGDTRAVDLPFGVVEVANEAKPDPGNGKQFQYFYLEDFEDGQLNTPGLSISEGSVIKLGGVDSVDVDDGLIDGSGSSGQSWHTGNGQDFTINFDEQILGQLPTHAGFALTDLGRTNPNLGAGKVIFEALDINSQSLGTKIIQYGDNDWYGGTNEDRFLGVTYEEGISTFKISFPDGNWGVEIDHIQYGISGTPQGKIGDEFQVNTYTSDHQMRPAIASLSDGSFVITWESEGQDDKFRGIFAQRYDNLGNPLGQEFQVNTRIDGAENNPDITALSDGSFLITWHPYSISSYDGVFAQRYDSQGNKVGSEFQLDTTQPHYQSFPKITGLSDGGYVAIWQSHQLNVFNETAADLYGRRFDANNNPIGDDFLIHSQTDNPQNFPSVTALENGAFLVTWAGKTAAGSYDIYARSFDANGNAIADAFKVNTFDSYSQYAPVVATLSDGSIAIAWHSEGQYGENSGIYGRRFDSTGTPLSQEFKITSAAQNHRVNPDITGLSNGNFVVTWQAKAQDTEDFELYGQRFDRDGKAIGDEFQINTETANAQMRPVVASLPDGKFVTAWQSGDESRWGIFAQLFGNAPEDPSPNVAPKLEDAIALESANFVYLGDGDPMGAGWGGYDFNAVEFVQDGEIQALKMSDLSGQKTSKAQYQRNLSYAETTLAQLYGWKIETSLKLVGDHSYYGSASLSYNDGEKRYQILFGTDGNGNLVINPNGDNGADVRVLDGVAANEYHAIALELNPETRAVTISVDGTEAIADYRGHSAKGHYAENQTRGGVFWGWTSGSPATTGEAYWQDVKFATLKPEAMQGHAHTITYEELLAASDATDANGDEMSFVITAIEDGILTKNGQAIALGNTTLSKGETLTWTPESAGDDISAFTVKATDGNATSSIPVSVTLDVQGIPQGKIGEEFAIDSELSQNKIRPFVTTLQDGGFIVTWESYQAASKGNFGQRYDALGNLIGKEFQINANHNYHQNRSAVSALDDGGFIATWQSYWGQDGSSTGIFAQRYDADSNPIGEEFLVNTHTVNSQETPAIATLSNGEYVIIWQSFNQDGSGRGIYGQRFDRDSNPIGTEFALNTQTEGEQRYPTLTALKEGGFVATWTSESQDGNSDDIYARRYDANGNAIGQEFLVNTYRTSSQYVPAIATLEDGSFVIAWHSVSQDDNSTSGIYGQRYDSNGDRLGGEFKVNTISQSDQLNPAIAPLSNGGFAIVWQSKGYIPSIYGQRYDSNGDRIGGEFRLNSEHYSARRMPTVAGLPNGKFVTFWQSLENDIWDIHGQISGNNAEVESSENIAPELSLIHLNPVDAAHSGSTDPLTEGFTEGWNHANAQNTVGVVDDGGVEAWHIKSTGSDSTAGYHRSISFAEATLAKIYGWKISADLKLGEQAGLPDGSFVTIYHGGSTGYSVDWGANSVGDLILKFAREDHYITHTLDGVAANEYHRTEIIFDPKTNTAKIFVDGKEIISNYTGQTASSDIAEILGASYFFWGSAWGSNTEEAYWKNASFEVLKPKVMQGKPHTITYEELLAASDAKDANGDEISFVITNIEDGMLTKNGQTVTQNATLSKGETLTWTPESAGDDISAFTVKATDGNATSSTPVSVTLDVQGIPKGAITDEIQVNTYTASSQSRPALATLADGSYVVTWQSYEQDGSSWGVFAQRYDALGNPLGAEFQINTETASTQEHPSIAALQDGGFIVAWESLNQDSNGKGIFAQRFDGNGDRISGEFQVNSESVGEQLYPAIASLTNGDFVITWQSEGKDGSAYGIFGQRYNSQGNALGNEFQINTTTANDQSRPAISSLQDGGFLITWASEGQDGDFEGIYGQRYNANGVKVGGEFNLNTYSNGSQYVPTVTSLADGGFVVAWQSEGQDGSAYGIFGQCFDSNSQPVGEEFRINTEVSQHQINPAIAPLSNGGFVVTWQSYQQDGSNYGIHGQRFDSDGNAIGDEFQINTSTFSRQILPSVTPLENDTFAIAWHSHVDSGDNYTSVFSRIFGNEPETATTENIAPQLNAIALTAPEYNHQGDTDPTTEGWINTFNIQDGNILRAVDDNGTAAWSTNDDGSTYLSGGGYSRIFSEEETVIADKYGWKMSANLKIVDPNDNPGGSIQATYQNGFDHYQIFWGSNAEGDVLIHGVTDETGVRSEYTLTGVKANEYHDYEMIFDPQTKTLKVLVDGVEKIANYGGYTASNSLTEATANQRHIFWGSASSEDTGEAYWQSVNFETLKPKATQGSPYTITYEELLAASDATDANGDDLAFVITSIEDGTLTKNGQVVAQNAAIGKGETLTWTPDSAGDALSAFSVKAYDGQDYSGNSAIVPVTVSPLPTQQVTVTVHRIKEVDNMDLNWLGTDEADFRATIDINGTNWTSPVQNGQDDASPNWQLSQEVTGKTVPISIKIEDEDTFNFPFDDVQDYEYVDVNPLSGSKTLNLTYNLLTREITGSSVNGVAGEQIFVRGEGDSSRADLWFSIDAVTHPYKIGGEFQINSQTENDQAYPAIAALKDGGFVIVWPSQNGSDWDIYGQRYDNNSNKIGGEFLVNSNTSSFQQGADIVGLENGGFIVTWQSFDPNSNDWDIYGQRYDKNGNEVGNEFLVNTNTLDQQRNQAIAALKNGGFVITWEHGGQNNDYGILGQIYDRDGNKIGSEFTANSHTDNDQWESNITALKDGGFVITWESQNQDGSLEGVYAQRYNSNGDKVDGEFQVNSHTLDRQETADLTALEDGGFIIVWESGNQDGNGYGIYAQRYDSNGDKVDGEFQVNSYTNQAQRNPSVASLQDGGYLIAWTSQGQDGSGEGIYAQRYYGNGTKVGGEIQVNSYTSDSQSTPDLVTLTDGSVVVVWDSQNQDGSDRGIFAQRFGVAPTTPQAPQPAPPSPSVFDYLNQAYNSLQDSPLSEGASIAPLRVETFEDGVLDTLGVTASAGSLAPVSHSIEENGNSWQVNQESLTFTFDGDALGALPTRAGVAVTDIANADIGTVAMEIFDSQGVSLGVTQPEALGTGDRFFGVEYEGGIAAITFTTNSNDWNIDHLQYG
ncbi:MAG: S8 family serine peptidase [Cyanobacteria bacterium P01_E01_bin.42]